MVQKFKILVTKPVLDVPFAASKEIIDNRNFMSLQHQLVNQVGTDEAGTSSYLQSAFHCYYAAEEWCNVCKYYCISS